MSNLVDELRGDYQTMCRLKAAEAKKRADDQAQVYGNGPPPEAGAIAERSAWQIKSLAEQAARKAALWTTRADYAAKGTFVVQKSDGIDPEFLRDENVRRYKDAALSKGLLVYEES